MPVRILTWNINGIRAVKEKSTKQLLDSLHADIICLQETKITRDMLDEPIAIVEGYDSYFSFSRKKTGYSGTANYCSVGASPLKAEEGLTGRLSFSSKDIIKCYGNTEVYSDHDLDSVDAEGRCVITLHQIRLLDAGVKDVAILNVYVPRAGGSEERLQYKLKFLNLLQSRAEALLEQKIHVIILGDMNLTHRKMDNCDSDSDGDFKLRSSRIWMNELLQKSERDSSLPATDTNLAGLNIPNLKGSMFSDVYRHLHSNQENAFTNWNTGTDARKTNYGKRLDYILIDTELAHYVSSCEIMPTVEGSDHCPVVVTLNCDPVPSKTCPQLCSKHMPEFKGQQQKLSSFFSKSVKQDEKCHPSILSVPSSPDGFKKISSSSVEKSSPDSASLSISQQMLKKNAKSVKLPSKQNDKRNLAVAEKHKNMKRMKITQNETATKQVSLKSFFVKVHPAGETVTGKGNGEVTRSSPTKLTDDMWISDCHSSYTLPLRDSEICKHHSEKSVSLSKSQEKCQPQHSSASAADIGPSMSISVISTCTSSDTSSVITTVKDTSQAWKSLLTGPPPLPLCPGHKEPCILKTVNKKGPNKNKKFYICARPEGAPGNPEHRCNFFQWYTHKK